MSAAGAPLATFTAVRYSSLGALAGAWHMAAQRPRLARVPGLRFFRLMGTGSGIGFSARPDLRTWALFAVWDSDAAWHRFRDTSRVMTQYRSRGREVYTLRLQPLSAHGQWGGTEPFGTLPPAAAPADPAEPVVVLTRASIRLRRLARFWSRVGPVDATLRDRPELLLSFGAGETPYLHQATLSVWSSAAAMRAWAYATPTHRDVVARTRQENWYAEELFARFRLLGTEGRLHGDDPLEGVTPNGARADPRQNPG